MTRNRNSFDTSDKDDLENRLNAINERLGRNVQDVENREKKKASNTGMAMGLRLGTEFVSAILVGSIIGYGIDWIAGTKPWAMILFLMLGFVAGVMNVLRASGEMSSSYELNVSKDNNGSDELN